MIGTEIVRDRNGKIMDDTISSSLYQPSDDVKELTGAIRTDYSIGHNNMNRTYEEFDDRSLTLIMNDNQRAFNAYIGGRSQNPDESWRADTVRPLTRDKVITMAAHLTASIMVPGVFAQNKEDEEDKEAAEVMSDLVEWVIRNSDYEESFLFAVIGALVNPVTIMKAECFQASRQLSYQQMNF